jgi:hypothetical protein
MRLTPSWPVLVAIGAAIAALVGTTVYFGSTMTPTGHSGPIGGSTLMVSSINESSTGNTSWYNFTLVPESSLRLGQLRVQVLTPSGAVVASNSAWQLGVRDPSGHLLAEYSFPGAGWIIGSDVTVRSSEGWSLEAGNFAIVTGDDLVLEGVNGFSGWTEAPIP